jgi:hypothetical protein
VVGAESPEVPLAGIDLRAQLVDHPQARAERRRPGLGQGEPGEQLAACHPEQVRDGHGVAERHECRVDPVLQRGPVVDEVEPEAGPLALRPDLWGRQR